MRRVLRLFLAIALVAALASCRAGSAEQEGKDYAGPTDTVTIWSGVPPGGGIDLAVNNIIKSMDGIVDQRIRLDHAPGAGGLLAVGKMAGELNNTDNNLFVCSPTTLAASLTAQQGTKVLSDLTPISRLFAEYTYFFVKKGSKYTDLKVLADAIKANPAAVKIGGAEVGGSDSITMAKFAEVLGVAFDQLAYVGMGGAEGPQNLLGGNIEVWLGGPETFDFVRSGEFDVIAGSSEKRVEGLDVSVPTMTEQGFDVVNANWRGVFAPSGISDSVRDYWNQRFVDMSNSQTWKDLAKKQGWDLITLDSAAFGSFLEEQSKVLTKVLTDFGLMDK